MNANQTYHIHVTHCLLAIFFLIAGTIALIANSVLSGAWAISLGLFLLFRAFEVHLHNYLSKLAIQLINAVFVATVLISGLFALLVEFKVIP